MGLKINGEVSKTECSIFCAGEYFGYETKNISADDYIIAADGGFAELEKSEIKPDFTIGDFDSLGKIPNTENICILKPEKDDTDTLCALREALKRDFDVIKIYGGTGGRLDHTLANIQLTEYCAENKKKCFLFGKNYISASVCNGEITFPEHESGIISVFSFGGKAGKVNISGLKYGLSDGTLSFDYPLGISNEFTGESGKISVSEGVLTVIWETEDFDFLPEIKFYD